MVIPIPLSMIDRVLLTLSGTILMKSSGCESSLLLSVKLSNRILSNAYITEPIKNQKTHSKLGERERERERERILHQRHC